MNRNRRIGNCRLTSARLGGASLYSERLQDAARMRTRSGPIAQPTDLTPRLVRPERSADVPSLGPTQEVPSHNWRRLGLMVLALSAALLWGSPAAAQVTLVSGQSATQEDGAGAMWTTGSLDQTLIFPGGVTSGNTVIAWTIYASNARTMSCTHDGNAMTNIAAGNATASLMVHIFARVATTTGTGITCTISGNDTNPQLFGIAEFAGLAAALSTQGGAGVSATTAAEVSASTTHDSGADLTPDTAHSLFVGGVMWSGGPGTVGLDGFTALHNTNTGLIAYRIETTITAADWVPTSTNSRSSEVAHQNLDGAGGAPPARNPSALMLMGVG